MGPEILMRQAQCLQKSANMYGTQHMLCHGRQARHFLNDAG
jgi:hypothetical protein